MRYIVDINKGHSDKINELIERKRYESVSRFISAAIENQLYLEKADINTKSQLSHNKITVKEKQHGKNRFPQDNVEINIPLENSRPETVDMPKFKDILLFPNGKIEDCWLWGQINRIFPIKLGLRLLLSKLEYNSWTDLEEFRDYTALIACKYRQMIDNAENYGGLSAREIAAGLPLYYTNNIDKLKVENSMNRYKNQFLAYVRVNDGKLDGALNQLKFTNIKKETKGNEEKYLIGITGQGVKFAKLFNPLIDKQDLSKTLSDEEKSFYINHIRENHKGEYRATLWLLRKLKNGFSTRAKINEELKRDYNYIWRFKDQVINTQRSGLTARMTELGLIDKIKKGVKVTYLISEYGQEVLKNE